MKLDILDTMKKFSALCAPAGYENSAAELIKGIIAEYADEITSDTMGNLIAHKKGDGSGKRIMFSAHMDSIGMIVTHIDDKGFIRFSNLGGLSPVMLLGTPVKFANGTRGVISKDGSVELKDMKIADLYIDIGASSKEEAEKCVSVADTAVYATETYMTNGNTIVSPYLDDRICCIALMEAMMNIKESKNDLWFVFSAQEELGLRGARTAAFGIDPEIGIAVDVTRAGDTPKPKPEMDTALGKGAAVKVIDSSLICSPVIVDKLKKLAGENDIQYQMEVLVAGGTDAGAMQLTRGGVYAGAVSVPTRYIHSPSEMADIRDVEASAKLLEAFAKSDFDF